jgi:hypothetical protein
MSETIAAAETRVSSARAGGTDSEDLVDALNDLAIEVSTVEPTRARSLVLEAREIADRMGYAKGLATCTALLGFVAYMLSDFETALPLLSEARAMVEEMGEPLLVARVLGATAVYISASVITTKPSKWPTPVWLRQERPETLRLRAGCLMDSVPATSSSVISTALRSSMSSRGRCSSRLEKPPARDLR